MFEFKDEKLGNVKVVNVTEARASIATMMSDREFNYVITKNNKPIRVVVNFETFKQGQMGSQSRSQKTEAKSSLQGLIQSQEKELKRQVLQTTEAKEEALPKAVGDHEALPKSLPTEPKPSEPEVAEELNYFHPQDQKSSSEETILEDQENISSSESGPVLDVSEKEVAPEADKEAAEAAPLEPEDENYFNRYKKLYETAPRHENLYQNGSNSIDDALSEQISPASKVSESPSPEIIQQSTLEKFDIPVATEAQEVMPEPPSGTLDGVETHQEGAPSIQDILRDLESEKLSGEEEEKLTSEQINQFVNKLNGNS